MHHLILQFFVTILLIINSLELVAQPLGTWQVHLPYRNPTTLTQSSTHIYTGTEHAAFSYSKADGVIDRYHRANGFADLNITALGYSEAAATLVIAYENGNIDLLKNDTEIINLSDVKRSTLTATKQINHIYIQEKLAYLSCNFGIVVLDIEREEIKDTYIIGESGAFLTISQVAISDKYIVAATESGVFYAPINSPNLANFNNWETIASLPQTNIDGIAFVYNRFYIAIKNELYVVDNQVDGFENWELLPLDEDWTIKSMRESKDQLVLTQWQGNPATEFRISIMDADNNFTHYTNTNLSQPLESIIGEGGQIWVADLYRGLLVFSTDQNGEFIIPNGPHSNKAFKILARNDEIWVASGGVDNSWAYRFIQDGFFQFKNGDWTNFNQTNTSILDGMRDFISIAIHPNQQKNYFGSYGWGLLEYDKDTEVYTLFDDQNSSLQEVKGDAERYRISGLGFDATQNLWIANYGAPAPISVYTTDGQWQAFTPDQTISENGIFDMVIDDWGQKWMLVKRDGVLIYDSGTDILSAEDDRYKLLQTGAGKGDLPALDVKSIAKDRDGHIWVGTSEGVAVFYCSFNVFNQGSCDATRPFVEVDGFGAYLLSTEVVRAIAVDGANRKWLGTENGLWLMSADGKEQINYFTTDNSPLLSNIINTIAIDDQTGEVYIGTDRGIVSYKGSATVGDYVHGEILAYPNPVRPDYTGTIIIKGLAQNAEVKITDVSGNLLYEMTALGGQAIWDGRDYNGRKASSGVYLIFSTNEDGQDSKVGKLLIMN